MPGEQIEDIEHARIGRVVSYQSCSDEVLIVDHEGNEWTAPLPDTRPAREKEKGP